MLSTPLTLWASVAGKKPQRQLVARIRDKNAEETIAEAKKALDSIDRSQGAQRVAVTPNIKSRDTVSEKLSTNGKARPEERSPGYPKHGNPEKGPYEGVHVEAGLMTSVAAALAPQASRLAKDPETSYYERIVAGLWDAVSTLDPIFLTDGIEAVAGCGPDDF